MNKKLIERTGGNAVGEKCHRVLHDLDHVCPWCVNERVFRGETVRWEVLSPKDNHWYYIVNTPLRRKDGTISKMAVIQDITERRLSEERTRQQNEFITHVLESLTHPFYVIDTNNYKVLMADSAASGMPPPTETTCYAHTHGRNEPCDTSRHSCPIEEVEENSKAGDRPFHYKQNGDAETWRSTRTRVSSASGNVAQILEYGLDVTDRGQGRREADRGVSANWRIPMKI